MANRSTSFFNLFQHRFASHCCEKLFRQAAPIVSQELVEPATDSAVENVEPVVSMENLFLYAINELEGNLGFLLTDNFGAHVLRLLLVVLSGQPLEESTPKSLLASKRKEKVSVANVEKEQEVETRAVPESFAVALEKMIGDSVAGLETHYLRTLATHHIGNPTLQALIRIELTSFGKQRAKENTSILKKLLPDDPLVEGTESAAFINNLVYDQVGSRLLETILEYAPGKLFKSLYKELFRDRMGSLARNEIAGYVVAKILERLSSEDLTKAVELILPQVPNLAERGRTSLVRTIIERCAARGVDTAVLASTIHSCWADDDKPTDLALWKMLQITPLEASAVSPPPPMASASTIASMDDPSPTTNGHPAQTTPPLPTTPAMLHSSHLAQTMLKTPGATSELINAAISNLTDTLCLRIAFTPILSPILQTSLTVADAPLIFRRKLIKRFYSHICSLALDPAGSHLVDAIWSGTQGLAFARERIAEELAESEGRLRDSKWGRMVWRNWKMDLYRRRRGEWVRSVRTSVGNDGFLSFPGGSGDEGTVTGIAKAGDHKVKKGKSNKKISQSEANAILRNGGTESRKIRRLEAGQQAPMLKQPVVPNRGYASSASTSKSRLDQARERFIKNKEKKEREAAKLAMTTSE